LFQSGILSFIVALKTTSKELEELKQIFIKLDTSRDGTLSLQEIQEGMNLITGSDKGGMKDYVELMKSLDKDGDGSIDYTEFITGAIDKATLLNVDNLTAAFKLLDADNSGTISIEELKHGFDSHGEKDDEIWKEIMAEADKNKDGQISFEEFTEVMSSLMKMKTKAAVFKA
jgi:calcium-dependent protein kinase